MFATDYHQQICIIQFGFIKTLFNIRLLQLKAIGFNKSNVCQALFFILFYDHPLDFDIDLYLFVFVIGFGWMMRYQFTIVLLHFAKHSIRSGIYFNLVVGINTNIYSN